MKIFLFVRHIRQFLVYIRLDSHRQCHHLRINRSPADTNIQYSSVRHQLNHHNTDNWTQPVHFRPGNILNGGHIDRYSNKDLKQNESHDMTHIAMCFSNHDNSNFSHCHENKVGCTRIDNRVSHLCILHFYHMQFFHSCTHQHQYIHHCKVHFLLSSFSWICVFFIQ